tara:strand:+ start:736478 stop:736669 length:192 start_codon:yes stop_codon:yes gene_type:complete
MCKKNDKATKAFKNFGLFLVAILILGGSFMSCSMDDEFIPSTESDEYLTGDTIDDPIEPDEED